ncbi:integrase [Desulfuromonas thiophila]|uniref:integrase n=1 Tax=Desulfuromonas thiophila TaxID=57664 RepID=UPI0024A9602B|nr:site-specific integrase [Desulfuromonas thiophila]
MARRTRGLYKRGKIWWLTYQGTDGKQYFESSGSQIKADAEFLLNKRRLAIAEGSQPLDTLRKAKQTTFAALADEYERFIAGQKSAAVKRLFLREMRAEFGTVRLSALNLAAVENWKAKLLSEPRPGRKSQTTRGPLAVASVNRHLACFKHMLRKGFDWELITRETFDRLCRVKLDREENARLRFLSPEESARLIDCAAPHLRPLLIAALNTGCRKGELLGLTWDRVDLRHGFIRLTQTKSGKPREIPINATFREVLERLPRNINPAGLVFVNPDTGAKYHDLKRSFATACRRAGIHDFTFHDLRHCFASQLVMSGVDLTSVSRLLGHASLTMTLRYAHLAPDHLQSAVAVLDRLSGSRQAAGQKAAR